MGLGLRRPVAAAWSYSNGALPRRVALLGIWALMRAADSLTDAYYRSAAC